MKSSKKIIYINHKAIDLYNIVLDIDKYPSFIPWCNSIIIKSRKKNEIFADMIISYKLFINQKFSSHVKYNEEQLIISTKYLEGPLKDLDTRWKFNRISKYKTKIIFDINFEFKNYIHQKIAEIFFVLIEYI